MARARFSPPQVATAPSQRDIIRAPRPPRYLPWSVGEQTPRQPPEPEAPAQPAAPEPPPSPMIQIPAELVEQAFDQARQQGFAAGVEEGRAAGIAETEEERQRLASSIAGLAEVQEQIAAHYRQEALQVALAAAEAMARVALEQRADVVTAVISEMLGDFSDASPIELRLSAHDRERIAPFIEQLRSQHERFKVVEDRSFRPGDIKLSSPTLISHSRLQDRIDLVRKLLEGSREDEPATD